MTTPTLADRAAAVLLEQGKNMTCPEIADVLRERGYDREPMTIHTHIVFDRRFERTKVKRMRAGQNWTAWKLA